MSNSDIKVSKNLQALAKMLDKELEKVAGQRMGFSLIVFSDNESGETNYVSNCARNESAKALSKVLKKWELSEMIDIPAHLKN
ncbi:hypothetical protein ACRN9F_02240 [Shewanella oncorhynchi]|uniref:hypothetical protein n=1 Tax=Shewanella oncorhynchi TaxID=2726434 RepID=UPI003D7C0445